MANLLQGDTASATEGLNDLMDMWWERLRLVDNAVIRLPAPDVLPLMRRLLRERGGATSLDNVQLLIASVVECRDDEVSTKLRRFLTASNSQKILAQVHEQLLQAMPC